MKNIETCVDKGVLEKTSRQVAGQSVIQTDCYPGGTHCIIQTESRDKHYAYTEETAASHSVRYV